MLVFALFPVYWVVLGSFDKSGSLSSQELVPKADDLGLQNYRTLFDDTDFWTWFRNSLVICVATAFFTVMLAAMAAFAFSRLQVPGPSGRPALHPADPDVPVVRRRRGDLRDHAEDR